MMDREKEKVIYPEFTPWICSNANFLTSFTNKSIFSSLGLRSSAHWKLLHPLQSQNLQFGFFVVRDVNNSM